MSESKKKGENESGFEYKASSEQLHHSLLLFLGGKDHMVTLKALKPDNTFIMLNVVVHGVIAISTNAKHPVVNYDAYRIVYSKGKVLVSHLKLVHNRSTNMGRLTFLDTVPQ